MQALEIGATWQATIHSQDSSLTTRARRPTRTRRIRWFEHQSCAAA